MGTISFKHLSYEETWKIIASHLSSKGIEVVLVGGGVATIYSKGGYLSGDLDFVISWGNDHKQVEQALSEIGFVKKGRIYRHSETLLSLDFSSPPIEVGEVNEPEISEEVFNGEKIFILSPTECVKDRLNKFHYFKDHSALDAALAVAKTTPYSLSRVESFCVKNKIMDSYECFLKRLSEQD